MIIGVKFEKGTSVGYKRTVLYLQAAEYLGIQTLDTRDMLNQLANKMITLKLKGTQGSIEFED